MFNTSVSEKKDGVVTVDVHVKGKGWTPDTLTMFTFVIREMSDETARVTMYATNDDDNWDASGVCDAPTTAEAIEMIINGGLRMTPCIGPAPSWPCAMSELGEELRRVLL